MPFAKEQGYASIGEISDAGLGAAAVSAAVDVNKPIFIGGGGEGYNVLGQDLTEAVEPFIRTRAGGGNLYTYKQDGVVKGAMRTTLAAGKAVILIGHSWGGSDAIGAAKWAKDNEDTCRLADHDRSGGAT